MILKVNIGLLGYGTVGSGVVAILSEHKALIEKRLYEQTGKEYDIEIKKILVRDLSKYPQEIQHKMTTDFEDILHDESISIVCELIGGDDVANKYMKLAIDKHKDVVTANKKAIFTSQGGLIDYAFSKHRGLKYEGSVAGVVPVIKVVEESLIGDEITEFQGILNGSTNYILTKISEGLNYQEAFTQAQDNGYLEQDPSSDIEGYDAMYKLGILVNLVTGVFPKESEIDRVGINSISSDDIKKARDQNLKIKLIASYRNNDGVSSMAVKPEFIDASHPMYHLDGSMNGVLLKCKNSGELFLSGAGAGSRETAISVITDIVSLLRSKSI